MPDLTPNPADAFRDAIARQTAQHGTRQHIEVAASLVGLGHALLWQDDAEGARAALQEALLIQQDVLPEPNDPSTIVTLAQLAQSHRALGNAGKALAFAQAAWGLCEHHDVVQLKVQVGPILVQILGASGQVEAARALADQVMDQLKRLDVDDPVRVQFEEEFGIRQAKEPTIEDARGHREHARDQGNASMVAATTHHIATLLAHAGELDEALAEAEAGLAYSHDKGVTEALQAYGQLIEQLKLAIADQSSQA